jgi:hypothetical protein
MTASSAIGSQLLLFSHHSSIHTLFFLLSKKTEFYIDVIEVLGPFTKTVYPFKVM